MKTPKFWYKKNTIISKILEPFSKFWLLLCYINDNSNRKVYFKAPIICIGNAIAGGAGKTPLIQEICKEYKKFNLAIHVIYKAYKIKLNKDVLKVNPSSKAEESGDEAILTSKLATTWVCKKREYGINAAISDGAAIVLLDDGLQDLSINYDLCFVCFNNINWIGNGLSIPSGPLRENLNNLKKYKHIFLNGNLENLENIKRDILKINSEINIYIGKYIPENIKEFNIKDRYLAFSGIGNHRTFISMLKSYDLNIVKDIEFPDHYKYLNTDIKKIILDSKNLGCKIITTEKDFLRLQPKNYNEIKFIKSKLEIQNEAEFLQTLTKII